MQMREKCDETVAKEKNSKNNIESMQKETKFMSDNIKRLASEKTKIERKMQDAEKKSARLAQTLEKVEEGLERRGMTLKGILGSKYSHLAPGHQDESSLDLNDFIG